MLKGKKILVTGGAGSIGAMLVRLLAPENDVFIFDIDDTRGYDLAESLKFKNQRAEFLLGDVRKIDEVKWAISKSKPNYIFHCAALKTVPSGQDYPRDYVETNICGTDNLLTWKDDDMSFVFVSTDKAAGPTSVMGGTKLMGEILTKNAGGIVVRFGNVMGSQGSLLPLWQGQIDRGEPMTITDPACERYFMTIDEACGLIVRAAEEGQPGETLILDMGHRVKIGELAQQIISNTRASIETKLIGLRPGEALVEKLMTAEESARSERRGDFHVFV